MNGPAVATAQINEDRREEIGRRCQGNQLGDAQPCPTGKTAVAQQPTVRSAKQGAQRCCSEQQLDGANDLAHAIGAKIAEAAVQRRQGLPHQRQHRPDRNQASDGGDQDQGQPGWAWNNTPVGQQLHFSDGPDTVVATWCCDIAMERVWR